MEKRLQKIFTRNVLKAKFYGKCFTYHNFKGIINKPKNSVMLKRDKQSSIVIMDKWY